MISPGPDKDSFHPATSPMPTAAPPLALDLLSAVEQAVALDLLADVEQVAQEAEQACLWLSRARHDLQPDSVARLQRALCQLETAATHLHHITQR
jgi:predicted alpha/beta-hydrolase family hydrolase